MTDPLSDFTELTDAVIDRVDLVGAPANGRPFVLMKAAADGGLTQPLVPADQVRALLEKAQEAPVTDPAPTIVKAELDVTDAPAPDQLIPTPPGGSTANSLPGSADWEQLDGDTAMNAVAVLGRLKGVLGWLADREAQEAVTGGDYESGDNSWDLDNLACQIDNMIGTLAAFAVGEHMEADELDAVGKAVAATAEPLSVVERLAPIAKAGRTLSAANESALRSAASSIETVLNSLPAAPAEDVTKETAVPETPVAPDAAEQDPFALAKRFEAIEDALGLRVAKAKGDPQMAVFSADGKLVGVIDPADLNPIAATEAPAEGDTEGSADDPAPDPGTPADPAAPADPADGQVIPGTNTVQAPAPAPAPEDDKTPAVAKTAAPAKLEEDRVALLAKQVESLAADNEVLKEQVRKFGLTPDDRNSPVLNGATGVAGTVTRDSSEDDPYTDLRKAVGAAQSPSERRAALAALTNAQLSADIKARFAH